VIVRFLEHWVLCEILHLQQLKQSNTFFLKKKEGKKKKTRRRDTRVEDVKTITLILGPPTKFRITTHILRSTLLVLHWVAVTRIGTL